MIFMRRMFFYSIVPLLLFCERSAPVTGDTTHDRTLLGNAFQMTGILLGKCWNGAADLRREGVLRTFQGCLKRRCLVALDTMRSMDNIRISDGIELVKYRDDDDDVIYRRFGSSNTSTGDESEWKNQVLTKLMGIFENHILKIHLNQLKNITFEGRIRHRHHQHLLPVMLFGTMAIIMIAIPLGFQFLAVLGGKALLLAKLALILTSIQGLKKIATSNWNYGLYEAPNNNPWPFDRKWLYDSNDEHQSYQGYQGYNQEAPTNLLHPLSPRIDNYYYK